MYSPFSALPFCGATSAIAATVANKTAFASRANADLRKEYITATAAVSCRNAAAQDDSRRLSQDCGEPGGCRGGVAHGRGRFPRGWPDLRDAGIGQGRIREPDAHAGAAGRFRGRAA